MTKFIPVAFALVAFTASLSPALAGNGGDRIGNVNGNQATYTTVAPVAPATDASQGTYHYTDAEAAVIRASANHL